jgi:RNA polymerase sigma factor (sigma-70 family)
MMTNYTNINDNIKIYFREIHSFKSMTRQDEISLFTRISKGDKSAETEIFNKMAKLAVNIAKTYTSNPELLEDLIQEANMGILDAIKKYNLSTEIRFSSYARFWMKANISKYLDELGVVHHNNTKLIDMANKIREKFYKENQRDISDYELMDALEDAGEVVNDISSIINITNIRIDIPSERDDDNSPMGGYGSFADRTASINGFEEQSENESLSSDIARRLSRLDQREQKLILMKFGFITGFEMDYGSIMERWNEEHPGKESLTQERIRQIIVGALKKMK